MDNEALIKKLARAAAFVFFNHESVEEDGDIALFFLEVNTAKADITDRNVEAIKRQVKAALEMSKAENVIELQRQPGLIDEIHRLKEEHIRQTQEAKSVIEEQQKRGWEDGW